MKDQTITLCDLHRNYLDSDWDGICIVCGHDYFHDCHGNCTCLSCNAQRQADEEYAAEYGLKIID